MHCVWSFADGSIAHWWAQNAHRISQELQVFLMNKPHQEFATIYITAFRISAAK